MELRSGRLLIPNGNISHIKSHSLHLIIVRTTLIATVMISSAVSHAQSFKAWFLNPNVYRSIVDLKSIRLTNIHQTSIYNDTVIIKATPDQSIDYKIINEDANGYIIVRVLPSVQIISDTSRNAEIKKNLIIIRSPKDLNTDDPTNAYSYYLAIKKDQFHPLGKTLLSLKIVGIPLIHPFKLRPSTGAQGWDLTGDFTVNYSFGVKFKLNKKKPFSQTYFTAVLYGFGVGAAKYFKQTIDQTLTPKEDAFAINYYQGGLMLTIQRINIGIFTGLDAMLDKRNDWIYQSKPWYSFGLGYRFKID